MLELATGLALVIGLLVGILGGGGSVLLVPVLLYLLKLEPKSALLTSQLVMASTTAVAMLVHASGQRVVFRTGLLFGLAGMVGAYGGGRVAHYLPSELLLFGFAALMVMSGAQMLSSSHPVADPASTRPQATAAAVCFLGVPTGFLGGLLGAGGGFLVVPALHVYGRLPIERAIGTSLLVIAMQSVAGAAGYLGTGVVDLRLAGLLAGTMAVGSAAGALLARRLHPARLRRLFAVLLLTVAAGMLLRSLWHLATS